MRFIVICLFALSSFFAFAQNPLKTALVGNNQSVYYSASKMNFANYKSEKIMLNDILDNRSLNWNKKINDTIKIELIRDFWKYPFKYLITEKLKRDLNDKKIDLTSNKNLADYIITATIESSYPKYFKTPERYFVYTRVNFNVLKNGVIKLEKGYEDFYNFNAESDEWHSDLNNNMPEATNYAMWIGLRRVLDKFYSDFDNVLIDLPVAASDVPLAVNAVTSNIANDEAIMKNQTPYSETNKKEDKPKSIKNASEKAAKKSINEPIETAEAKKPFESVAPKNAPSMAEKIEEKPKSNQELIAEYQKANKASQEQSRARLLDSVLQVKQKEAALAKAKKEQEITEAKTKEYAQKIKIDSLKALELANLEASVKLQKRLDSIKKAEVNKQIEIAKIKKEEAKKRLLEDEQAKVEKQQAEARKLKTQKEEARKLEAQKEEARKLEIAKLEQDRQAKIELSSKLEAEKKEAKRKADELRKIESEKMEAKRREYARLEAEKKEANKLAQEKDDKIKEEYSRLALAKLEEEKAEAKRLVQAKLEEEKAEAKRLALAKQEEEKAEAKRLALAKQEELKKIVKANESVKKDSSKIESKQVAQTKKETKKIKNVSSESNSNSSSEAIVSSKRIKAVKDSLTNEALKLARISKKETIEPQSTSERNHIKDQAPKIVKPSVSAYKSMDEYLSDSILYEKQLAEKKTAILALMNQAKTADRNNVDLLTGARTAFDPMYDSGDPTSPKSKVPDMRTAEEKAKDRIFTPQNEQSEKLLGQVLMISPTDEMKIESLFNSADIAERNRLIDSFFIAKQMNRSKFSENIEDQIKNVNQKKEPKDSPKSKDVSKKEIKLSSSIVDTKKETDSIKKEAVVDLKKSLSNKVEKKEISATMTPVKK